MDQLRTPDNPYIQWLDTHVLHKYILKVQLNVPQVTFIAEAISHHFFCSILPLNNTIKITLNLVAALINVSSEDSSTSTKLNCEQMSYS